MQIPLQITYRGMDQSDAVESRIRTKVQRLERLYPRISGCRVVLGMEGRQRHQGKLFNVRIDITVPQGEIAVNRHSSEDANAAIRDAFDAAARRLEEYGREQRGAVKLHPQPLYGQVTRVFVEEDHGYGFIETEDGREYYFSSENMTEPEFGKLYPGVEVQFIEGTETEGSQAKRVSTRHHGA